MELIESTFSETSKGEEKDAKTPQRATESSLHNAESQQQVVKRSATGETLSDHEIAEKSNDNPVVNESPGGKTDEQKEKDARSESASGEDTEDTPRRVPALKVARPVEGPLKPPATSRKNIIPSRRPVVDADKMSTLAQKEPLPAENTPMDLPTNQPDTGTTTDTGDTLQADRSQTEPEDTRTAADLPTRKEPAAIPGYPISNQTIRLHDTSAAEEAWQAVDLNNELAEQDTHILPATQAEQAKADEPQESPQTRESSPQLATATIEQKSRSAPETPLPPEPSLQARPVAFIDAPTTPIPAFAPMKPLEPQRSSLTRKKALFLVLVLAMILLNATAAGFNQFFGPQGWGSTIGGPDNSGPNLLTQIAQQLKHSPTPGTTGTPTPPTPTQIVNLLMSNMTLDEKLGQMMMIQFVGQSYSPELDAMISQYHVGSVLYFQFNIGSKSQLTGLNAEMQHNAYLPLLVAVDQEGGTVDRLVNLDGPQPPAAQIGATNDPNVAYQQGLKDARELASYGFNLNLAPVVDVNNVYNPQLYDRTFGNNPALVTKMASAYLKGLQQSGKVLGTLKHFPGLGDVSTDPHYGLPALTRSLSSLNAIDWAPYRNLIKQGNVYSIMVTHEIVDALDKTEPSSLSPAVIGILRNQMHFQGVIITDSLTMDSIHNFYTYGEAAAKAVEAGDDILMGADSPDTLQQMITGIKQAMNSGAITQQRIDDSVRRILLFKYEMGLLHV